MFLLLLFLHAGGLIDCVMGWDGIRCDVSGEDGYLVLDGLVATGWGQVLSHLLFGVVG